MGDNNLGMKKTKPITVKEIKVIEPKADIYELNKYCKYLCMIKKSNLAGGNKEAEAKASIVLQTMTQAGISCIILIGVDDDVKFMEFS